MKIFPMGGIGGVTKNMFLYESGQDLMVVDCGIGFPDATMPGVEFLIPDTQYLQDRIKQGATLHGIVLTHGHDDHIAALPYVLREIRAEEVPIYGSPLTAEFATSRLQDQGVEKQVEHFNEGRIKVGPFEVETVRVTHSVPDARHLVVRTPDGVVYHGSDFKIDLTPVDGVNMDLQRIAEIGREGVLCALLDSLRIERQAPGQSEAVVGPALRREMYGVEGKVFVTLMSSSIHRIQQVIDVAAEFGRKVTFIGRSVEQNVNTAMNLGMLNFPANAKLNKRNLDRVSDSELCVIIAGSQGQPGSSLVRAVSGEHRYISMSRGDKVIFSSEPIPGSETDVYRTINEIAHRGVEVVYSDIEDDLHVSGHAGAYEQMLMVHLLRPKFIFPIGGEERHRVQFTKVIGAHGYQPNQVVLPNYGTIVELDRSGFNYGEQVKLRERTVSGEGVSDVLASAISERQRLGAQGVMVVSLVEKGGQVDEQEIGVSTRGFQLGEEYTPEEFERAVRAEALRVATAFEGSTPQLRQELEKALQRYLMKEIGRSPLIVAAVTSL